MFSVEAHRGQVRKNEPDKPRIIHPISVGKILEFYGCDDNVVAAGYLHDVVEDTKYTLKDIKDNFGDDIAHLVDVATEPDRTLSWEDRKQYKIDLFKTLPLRDILVPTADKINNIEEIKLCFTRNNNRDFSRFKRGEEAQCWYYKNVYKSLVNGGYENLPMFKRLKEGIAKVFDYKENNHNKKGSIKLNIINAKIKELSNLRELCTLDKPLIVEFIGTPNTGKTAIINSIDTLLKINSFKSSTISNDKVINEQLEHYMSIFNDVILIDKGLGDTLIWAYSLASKKLMNPELTNKFIIENIDYFLNLVDTFIITYGNNQTMLERERKSLKNRGFVTLDNIEEYNNNLMKYGDLIQILRKKDCLTINTDDLSINDISLLVTDKILTKMKTKYLDSFTKKYYR